MKWNKIVELSELKEEKSKFIKVVFNKFNKIIMESNSDKRWKVIRIKDVTNG